MPSSKSSALASVVTDITAVFSDLDGTLVHYAKTLTALGYELFNEPPGSYRGIDEEDGDEIKLLLWDCYPESYRTERFRGIPFQFWRHIETGKIQRFYELYNLSLSGALISEDTILLMELLQRTENLYRGMTVASYATSQSALNCTPVVCCLITGARTSTFLRRRCGGALPQTAFEACEGGGKLWCRLRDTDGWFSDRQVRRAVDKAESPDDIFFPSKAVDVPMDDEWTNQFNNITGFEVISPRDENQRMRKGNATMWDLEAELRDEGFETDHEHYDTSFLIDIRKSPCLRQNLPSGTDVASTYPRIFDNAVEAERFIVSRFREVYNEKYGVEFFVNLGKGQVNARGGGKRGVMLRVLEKANTVDRKVNRTRAGHERFRLDQTVALFDDENDLQFAELCGAGILPSVTHSEVLQHEQWTCEPSNRKWFRPPFDGPLGSEWALRQIVLFKRQKAAVCQVDSAFQPPLPSAITGVL